MSTKSTGFTTVSSVKPQQTQENTENDSNFVAMITNFSLPYSKKQSKKYTKTSNVNLQLNF